MAKKKDDEDDDPEENDKEPERPTASATRSKQLDEEVKALKEKLDQAEYAKSELTRDFREKLSRAEEEKRKAEAASQFPPIDNQDGPYSQQAAPPAPKESAPFHLLKMTTRQDSFGNTILVPQDIPAPTFERVPRVEDVPANVLIAHGVGDYKIKDSTGKIVGGFNVAPVNQATTLPGQPVAPLPSGIGSLIPSRTQEALDIYDAGVKRKDPNLQKLGASMMQDIARGGGGGGDLASELQKLASMNNSVRSVLGGPGAGTMGTPGFMPSEEVQKLQLNYQIAGQQWAGVEKVAGAIMDRLPAVADKFKDLIPKAPNKEETAAAAQRIGNNAQGAIPQFSPPAPRTPPTPVHPPGTKAPTGSTVNCTGCGKTIDIDSFLKHLPCPGAGVAAVTPPPQSAPAPVKGGVSTANMQLTPEIVDYLGIMPMITGSIDKWDRGDEESNPEKTADFVWRMAGMPFKGEEKKRLISLVDTGYDQIVNKPELKAIIEQFNQWPNYSTEQCQVFLEVAQITGIMKQEDVRRVKTVDDLGPAVDEFRNHMAIQMGPRGREWICRLLNRVASLSGKVAPHPEFMKGATAPRGGRDNL